MPYSSPIPLKPYLERITVLCDKQSKKDLVALIVSLAKDAPSAGRGEFLSKIESNLLAASRKDVAAQGAVETLIDRITDLGKDVLERIESIQDGSYWDDVDDWEDGYDDEDPNGLAEGHFEELRSLLRGAGTLFLDGRLDEARRVYGALFGLIQKLEGETRIYFPDDLDLREARARYGRCVYHADGGVLTEDFVLAMAIRAPVDDMENSVSGPYPLLQDVIDARAEEMENIDSFLGKWKDHLLRQEPSHNRTADLLLEVVFRLDGLGEVGRLAEIWKDKQPRGYIFWLRKLEAQKEWKAIVKTIRKALEVLGEGKYRERVSEFLIEAASALHDARHIMIGKRERFFSRICDQNLRDLLAEAVAQNARERELETALRFLDGLEKPGQPDAFRVRLLIMAGRLYEASNRVKRERGIGWSTGNAGVVFGSILSVAAGHSDKAGTIKRLLEAYAERTAVPSFRMVIDDSKYPMIFYDEIIRGLKMNPLPGFEMEEMLSWAKRIGESRITGIVSNKHRGAYDRAAQVLGCLAEVQTAMGKKDRAIKLLHTYYNEKFNRYSAFRKEVRQVVTSSALLKNLGFSL